ncbi:MAG: outer membrane beta-barrel protein [Candidimonas sp.]
MTTRFALCGLLCFAGANGALAESAATGPGPYVGLFGGAGSAISANLEQKGAVILNPSPTRLLPIKASGATGGAHVSFGGAQVGYSWDRWGSAQSKWGLKPAVELEGIYLGKHAPTGEMPVMPRALGMQYVTIPMTTGVLLANAVFTMQTPYSDTVFPYLGVGAGIASISIKGSDSANPSEPGINHFNSDPDASASAFALQLKAGLKAQMNKHLSLFAEYRYLSINSTNYTFGATDYPGVHLPTKPWNVSLGRQHYNLFAVGLQYAF